MVTNELPLPKLDVLGVDLLVTTPLQRWIGLLRPFAGIGLFILAAHFDLWLLTPALVFLIFVAVVTVTHDVVHGTLGLSKRQTEWALFLMGATLMESGHAYRTTHRQHHTTFPGDDDPEGYPAKMSMLGAILYGPILNSPFSGLVWLGSRGASAPGGKYPQQICKEHFCAVPRT